MPNPLTAIVRKDLRIFFSDKKAVLISFLVPIGIASFFGIINIGGDNAKPAQKIEVVVADNDRSPVTQEVISKLRSSDSLHPKIEDEAQARKDIADGNAPVAVIFPPGFGTTSSAALAGGPKAELTVLSDPGHSIEAMSARGALQGITMQAIAKSVFGDSPATTASPFEVKQGETAKRKQEWSGMGHGFAGMALQGLLFFSINAAMGLLLEKKAGIWRRLRASPVNPKLFLVGRMLSSSIMAFFILVGIFAFAAVVFHLRIEGSTIGMALLCVTSALMAGGFGLLVASLGKTEEQARGLSILAVLVMCMLGGAWFPVFLMPSWVQTLSSFTPVRWAVEGFDGMTWRGWTLAQALPGTAALTAFAVLFTGIAFWRFNWEAE